MFRALRAMAISGVLLLTSACPRKPEVAPASPAGQVEKEVTLSKTEMPAASPALDETPAPAETPAATADEIRKSEGAAELKQMADFYQKLEAVQTKIDVTLEVKLPDDDTRQFKFQLNMAGKKPNQLSLLGQGTLSRADLVSDGKTLTTYLPVTNFYTETPAPDSFEALTQTEQAHLLGAGERNTVLLALLSKDLFGQMIEGVTKIELLPDTELDGQAVRHVKANQSNLSWEAWIDAGEKPWLRKITIESATPGNPPTQLTMTFHDWEEAIPTDSKVFTFTAPQGAMKRDSLFLLPSGGMSPAEEIPSPLLGKPAPEVKLPVLTGGDFDLQSHQGKNVVILDFWATWCGPCVAEMPILAKVAGEFENRGVVFCAINQREERDAIEAFLKKMNLDVSVALDTEGHIGDAFGVEGIPMLVIIDKKGKVQSVHVGYSPTIESTLRSELEAILSGKDLAEEAVSARAAKEADQRATLIHPEGLQADWTVPNSSQGLAADPNGHLYAAVQNEIWKLDASGKKVSSFAFHENATSLHLARLNSNEPDAVIAFRVWGNVVSATSFDGKTLWKIPASSGVDDIWTADINGDHRDEVIVGLNGSGGLHVYDANGQELWKYMNIGNVWHVCAGDPDEDGKINVVSTSATGEVHIFSATGELETTWKVKKPEIYANMVRVGQLSGEKNKEITLVIGSLLSSRTTAIAGLNTEGQTLWNYEFPQSFSSQDSAAVSSSRPWIAVSFRSGTVCVLNINDGTVLGSTWLEGGATAVTWLERVDQTPLLVAAGGNNVQSFSVVDADSAKTAPEGEQKPTEKDTK